MAYTRYLSDVLQDPAELGWLIGLFRENGVRSYLEIGSRYGGSLWRIANSLPKGSRVVSVDLPSGQTNEHLKACCIELQRRGYESHCILADSRGTETVQRVRRLGPFDACLIDGDHSTRGVTADWEHYGPLARLVAFHDISWKRDPEWRGTRIYVPEFWNSIKVNYRYEECALSSKKKDNGIGVLWR